MDAALLSPVPITRCIGWRAPGRSALSLRLSDWDTWGSSTSGMNQPRPDRIPDPAIEDEPEQSGGGGQLGDRCRVAEHHEHERRHV
jgi:hypothetical protein